MVESALVTLIKTSSAITTLIADRLYPDVIPQDAALPAVAYQVIPGGRADHAHSGRTKYVMEMVQLTIDAATVASAHAVADGLYVFLDGYMAGSGVIRAILYQSAGSDFANLSKLSTIRQDYEVHFMTPL